jgi:hypothetical protein
VNRHPTAFDFVARDVAVHVAVADARGVGDSFRGENSMRTPEAPEWKKVAKQSFRDRKTDGGNCGLGSQWHSVWFSNVKVCTNGESGMRLSL